MTFATKLASLISSINGYGTKTKTDITGYIPVSDKGAQNGVAPLVNGLIPAQNLPGFVDNVDEYNGVANFPAIGLAERLYIDTSTTNAKAYRWTGSGYFQVNNSVGNADVAAKLAAVRTISATGDANWSVNFDGSGNASAIITLNTVPVSKGGTGGTTQATARSGLGLVIGTDVQAFNNELNAIGAIAATVGLLKKTAAGAWTLDTNNYSLSSHNHSATYQPLDNDLSAIAGLAGTSGLLKKTATDTWVLDTGSYSLTSHNHDLTYAPIVHNHDSSYSLLTHNHDLSYSNITHNHTGTYQPIDNDLTAIAALAGTTGLLRKTAADTWTLDLSTYLTSVPAQTYASITGKPTTVAGYGITDTYTKTETDSRIQAVVGAAPAALDTLVEIAAQLASDESAASALTTAVAGKEPTIVAGTTAQYYRGDKTWRSFITDVLATVLTGLSTATATAIVATDSILVAFGKIQGQLNNQSTSIAGKEPTVTSGTTTDYYKGNKTWSDFGTDVRSTVLTGLSIVSSVVIVAGDNVILALGKLQAQITTLTTSLNNKADKATTITGYGITIVASDIPTLNQNTTGNAATATVAIGTVTTNSYQVNSLGVGTASPPTGEIRATGNVTAYYSDSRLKDVSGNIQNALKSVCSLNGVVYKANELAESFGYDREIEQVGVLAQEVQLVLPQVVTQAPFDIAQDKNGNEFSISGEDYLTVRYERLVPLLIEAIKELKAEIDELKGK